MIVKLILLRHGQSKWNQENRFTGWKNVDLSEKGILEAKASGLLLKKNKIQIDKVFTSNLKRAINTAQIALKEASYDHLFNNKKLIIHSDQAMNERDYGDLTGLNKEETAKKYGKDQVHIWRRSYEINPPGGESLKDVVNRVKPYFNKVILNDLNSGNNIILSAHGNSLRALFLILKLNTIKNISKVEIPTGKPFIIEFKNKKIFKSFYL